MIKRKSLILGLISSFVICSVVALTLVGYFFYLQLKEKESSLLYLETLKSINARVYARHIEMPKLQVRVEKAGALKDKPIIEGLLKNNGPKNINDITIKLKFFDKDGAVIYESVIRPHEPSLGSSGFSQLAIPYLSQPVPRTVLKAYGELPFKKILTSCPEEIVSELRNGAVFSQGANKRFGRIDYEVISVSFRE